MTSTISSIRKDGSYLGPQSQRSNCSPCNFLRRNWNGIVSTQSWSSISYSRNITPLRTLHFCVVSSIRNIFSTESLTAPPIGEHHAYCLQFGRQNALQSV